MSARRKRIVRRISHFWFVPIVLAFLLTLGFWHRAQLDTNLEIDTRPAIAEASVLDEPIRPIPLEIEGLDPKKVALGNQLFHDARLSGDGTISCASCHNLKLGGTDRLPVSRGVGGALGTANAPTVFNSAYNFKQFWDGRAKDLEEQIDGPILSPIEMDGDWSQILRTLGQIPEYATAFRELYPDGIAIEAVKNAIATFERSLITPNAPFDRYLKGDLYALTPREKEGYRRFKAYGCATCHQGINIGGNLFQGLGIFGDYFKDRGRVSKADFGRYNVTGRERDRYTFKVPGLRNIVLTSPYFHDGSVPTLAAAVRIMGQYQLGRELSSEDIDLIIDFLMTLTGEYQGEPL